MEWVILTLGAFTVCTGLYREVYRRGYNKGRSDAAFNIYKNRGPRHGL